MKNKIIQSLIPVLFCLLSSCATSNDPSEAYQGESAQKIFHAGEVALRKNDYAEAVKRFEALDVQYPYGSETEKAQLQVIYAYYMNSDFLLAEAAADRFIRAHPTNPHVDYAYYMRGLSTYFENKGVFEKLFNIDFATRDLTQVKKSFDNFNMLVTHFPASSYAKAAYQYKIYLRNILARHQFEVAQYYYSRKAYVAAIDRASLVVQHYQGSPHVPDALVMMVKCYRALQLEKLAQQTLQVLQLNYPNSKYLKDAMA